MVYVLDISSSLIFNSPRQLVATFKCLRATAISSLKDISADLIKRGKLEGHGSGESLSASVKIGDSTFTPEVGRLFDSKRASVKYTLDRPRLCLPPC